MDMPGMPGMDTTVKNKPMPGMNMSMPGMDMGADSSVNIPTPDSTVPSSEPTASTPLLMPKGHLEINDVIDAGNNLPNYSIEDLQKLATDNNPTLMQARDQIKGERGKALQAGLWPNPSFGYVGDLMGLPGAGLGEFQGGVAEQDVILGGKLKYSRKKYQARASAAEQQLIAQTWRVRNDVQIAFVHVIGHAQRLKLQEELFKSIKDMWLTANEMFNMGQVNRAGLRTANIELEMQRTKVLTAQNDLAQAWQELTTVVGINEGYRPLKGELKSPAGDINFNEIFDRLLKESPELGEAKEKLRSDEITVQREHRQPIPNVSLSGGAGYDQLDKGAAAVAGLTITNIPLWNRNQGTIQQAEADLERQHAQVRLIELILRRRLAEQYNTYKSAWQWVQAYSNVILPNAKSRYEIDLQSYKDIRTEWPDVLRSQREYVEARLDYINHLVRAEEAAVEINGFLLTGGLTPPPGVTPAGHIDATPQPR